MFNNNNTVTQGYITYSLVHQLSSLYFNFMWSNMAPLSLSEVRYMSRGQIADTTGDGKSLSARFLNILVSPAAFRQLQLFRRLLCHECAQKETSSWSFRFKSKPHEHISVMRLLRVLRKQRSSRKTAATRLLWPLHCTYFFQFHFIFMWNYWQVFCMNERKWKTGSSPRSKEKSLEHSTSCQQPPGGDADDVASLLGVAGMSSIFIHSGWSSRNIITCN